MRGLAAAASLLLLLLRVAAALELPFCEEASAALVRAPAGARRLPCVLYDTSVGNPFLEGNDEEAGVGSVGNESDTDSASRAVWRSGGEQIAGENDVLGEEAQVVTLVQVTPTNCGDHRDGAKTAVDVMNEMNAGKGIAVGFGESKTFVRFRFVAIVAGYFDGVVGNYARVHAETMEALFHEDSGLDISFIIGTCSFAASFEKELAQTYERILLAQVGPDSFYEDTLLNPHSHIFGVHVSSNDYTFPALQGIKFADPTAKIGIVTRSSPEFFGSTCTAALEHAKALGLEVVLFEMYDPDVDEDGDGINNGDDADFIQKKGNLFCESGANALFGCVLSDIEADNLVKTLQGVACNASATWMTVSTLPWGVKRPQWTPFFLGSGQWHRQFSFRDEFFESGSSLLEMNEEKFGYKGNYDTVGSYMVPYVFMKLLQETFRAIDFPDVLDALKNDYETIRRALTALTVESSIYGRITFNDLQRNIGRRPAGSQYLPEEQDEDVVFIDTCIAPSEAATASLKYPAPAGVLCEAGSFHSPTTSDSVAVLTSKCTPCQINTFTMIPNSSPRCTLCPNGSSTNELEGSTTCVLMDSNLLPLGIVVFGFIFWIVNNALALASAVWVFRNRTNPVVRVSQPTFLYVVCLGAAISSSTILALLVEAGVDEDTSHANAACMTFPWLYSFGFVLLYSSLFAKSWKLGRIVNNKKLRRVTISNVFLAKVILSLLLVDTIILLSWTLLDPLQWKRSVNFTSKNLRVGLVTVSTVGRCVSEYGKEWIFLFVLILVHFCILLGGTFLLYKVRNIRSLFQEGKYIAISLICSTQLLILGIPLLYAVGDDAAAFQIVLLLVIGLSDFTSLCFIFIPKFIAVNSEKFDPEAGDDAGRRKGIASELLRRHRSSTIDAETLLQQVDLQELESIRYKVDELKTENKVLQAQVRELVNRCILDDGKRPKRSVSSGSFRKVLLRKPASNLSQLSFSFDENREEVAPALKREVKDEENEDEEQCHQPQSGDNDEGQKKDFPDSETFHLFRTIEEATQEGSATSDQTTKNLACV